MHATDPVAPPLVRLEPMGVTREILRNHLAANEQTGEEGAAESKEMGKEQQGAERLANLASASMMLLSKLKGQVCEQPHSTESVTVY